VSIIWAIKCLILLMHGANMKLIVFVFGNKDMKNVILSVFLQRKPVIEKFTIADIITSRRVMETATSRHVA